MFLELGIATGMVLLTVLMHGGGLLLLGRIMELHDRRSGQMRLSPVSTQGALVAAGLAIGLLTLHGVEIWSYALLFRGIGAIDTLRDAVYFSTVSYGAIGYSDDLMAEHWRLLGAIEGVNGALLLGWSVAFFVTVMTRFVMGRGHHTSGSP